MNPLSGKFLNKRRPKESNLKMNLRQKFVSFQGKKSVSIYV